MSFKPLASRWQRRAPSPALPRGADWCNWFPDVLAPRAEVLAIGPGIGRMLLASSERASSLALLAANHIPLRRYRRTLRHVDNGTKNSYSVPEKSLRSRRVSPHFPPTFVLFNSVSALVVCPRMWAAACLRKWGFCLPAQLNAVRTWAD